MLSKELLNLIPEAERAEWRKVISVEDSEGRNSRKDGPIPPKKNICADEVLIRQGPHGLANIREPVNPSKRQAKALIGCFFHHPKAHIQRDDCDHTAFTTLTTKLGAVGPQ